MKWYEKQLRIQQTVLREIDILDYDAAAVVDYLKATESNCIVVNAGGIIDFFDNEVPAANPNRFMKDGQDILKDLTAACHAADIKVLVRVDFRGVEKRRYEQHPDWFAVNEHGQPVLSGHNRNPLPETLYAPCYLGYYRNEHAFEYAENLLRRYDLDGIWENAPSQEGVCYCRRCSEKYRADTGKELPRGGAFFDAGYDEYRAWKAENLLVHLKNFRKKIKAFGEDKAFCAEIFGLFYEWYKNTSADLYMISESMDFLVTPLFVANHEPLGAPAMLMKFLRTLAPAKTPIMLYGHLGTNNQLRYISSPPAEVKAWMWQAVASGGSMWDCTFNGHHPGDTHDRRNAYLAGEVFGFMKAHEDKLHGQQPIGEVAVLYSRRTAARLAENDRSADHYVTHLIGLEQVLTDNKVQYEFVLDRDLSAERLRHTRVLIVPNAAMLSDEETEVIRAFVAGGGSLLCTGRTSLLDETGAPRSDFALADVFGCSHSGVEQDARMWGYQRVAGPSALTRGFENTELIANWGDMILVHPHAGEDIDVPLTYVPRIFPQPPEKSWLLTLETPFPAVVDHTFGKGRSIFIPSEVDRNVWGHGHPDFTTLLENAIDALRGDRHLVETDAPVSVHFVLNAVNDRPGSYLLHAINLTSAPRRPIAGIVPVSDITVRLNLAGNGLKSATVLFGDAGGTKTVEKTAGADKAIEIAIPKIDEYFSILIEMRED